eukprot:gene12655-353_t
MGDTAKLEDAQNHALNKANPRSVVTKTSPMKKRDDFPELPRADSEEIVQVLPSSSKGVHFLPPEQSVRSLSNVREAVAFEHTLQVSDVAKIKAVFDASPGRAFTKEAFCAAMRKLFRGMVASLRNGCLGVSAEAMSRWFDRIDAGAALPPFRSPVVSPFATFGATKQDAIGIRRDAFVKVDTLSQIPDRAAHRDMIFKLAMHPATKVQPAVPLLRWPPVTSFYVLHWAAFASGPGYPAAGFPQHELYSAGHDGVVKRWSPSGYTESSILHDSPSELMDMALLGSGSFLAAATVDRQLNVYNTEQGYLEKTFVGQKGTVNSSLLRTSIRVNPMRLPMAPHHETVLMAEGCVAIGLIDVPFCIERLSSQGVIIDGAIQEDCELVALGTHGGSINVYPLELPAHAAAKHMLLPHVNSKLQDKVIKPRVLVSGLHGKQPVSHLKWSPSLRLCITSGWDKNLHLVDLDHKQSVLTLMGHQKSIHTFDYHTSHRLIASCSSDLEVLLWNTVVPKPTSRLDLGAEPVVGLQFVQNDMQLITLCKNKNIMIWDIRTNKLLQTIPETRLHHPRNSLSALLYCPDESAIWCASSVPQMWQQREVMPTTTVNDTGGDDVQENMQSVVCCLFSSLFNQVVLVMSHSIYTWDLQTGERCSSIVPDCLRTNSRAAEVCIRAATLGSNQHKLFLCLSCGKGSDSLVMGAGLASDGIRRWLCTTANGAVHLWRDDNGLQDMGATHQVLHAAGTLNCIEMCGDMIMALGAYESFITLCDVTHSRIVTTLHQKTSRKRYPVKGLAFSVEAQVLVAVHGTQKAFFWDLTTFTVACELSSLPSMVHSGLEHVAAIPGGHFVFADSLGRLFVVEYHPPESILPTVSRLGLEHLPSDASTDDSHQSLQDKFLGPPGYGGPLWSQDSSLNFLTRYSSASKSYLSPKKAGLAHHLVAAHDWQAHTGPIHSLKVIQQTGSGSLIITCSADASVKIHSLDGIHVGTFLHTADTPTWSLQNRSTWVKEQLAETAPVERNSTPKTSTPGSLPPPSRGTSFPPFVTQMDCMQSPAPAVSAPGSSGSGTDLSGSSAGPVCPSQSPEGTSLGTDKVLTKHTWNSKSRGWGGNPPSHGGAEIQQWLYAAGTPPPPLQKPLKFRPRPAAATPPGQVMSPSNSSSSDEPETPIQAHEIEMCISPPPTPIHHQNMTHNNETCVASPSSSEDSSHPPSAEPAPMPAPKFSLAMGSMLQSFANDCAVQEVRFSSRRDLNPALNHHGKDSSTEPCDNRLGEHTTVDWLAFVVTPRLVFTPAPNTDCENQAYLGMDVCQGNPPRRGLKLQPPLKNLPVKSCKGKSAVERTTSEGGLMFLGRHLRVQGTWQTLCHLKILCSDQIRRMTQSRMGRMMQVPDYISAHKYNVAPLIPADMAFTQAKLDQIEEQQQKLLLAGTQITSAEGSEGVLSAVNAMRKKDNSGAWVHRAVSLLPLSEPAPIPDPSQAWSPKLKHLLDNYKRQKHLSQLAVQQLSSSNPAHPESPHHSLPSPSKGRRTVLGSAVGSPAPKKESPW